ncbi:TM2 domain-containing protein [Candidatus Woesearchaeota archaeon]|nr:TM2 domain-containing protein [Candidatus Woesearchaeota archaeon]
MKKKNTAGVLALFLGGLGVHRFYLDEAGWGLLYLFFCWTYIPTIVSFFEALWFFFCSDEAFEKRYGKEK